MGIADSALLVLNGTLLNSVNALLALSRRTWNEKSFIAKRVKSILVNLRYLRFKLLKYKENKKICDTFDHNFKNIPLYMSKISLERYYFVLYNGVLTFKNSKNGA